jgi:hypothetical protein
MPVGPGRVEAERWHDTAKSLTAWEPDARWLVLVDDGVDDRGLTQPVDPGLEVVVLPHPLRGRNGGFSDRIAAGVLAGLAWIARNTDADVVLRLDTDALVIAPFADKLAGVFADESIGLVGSYDADCNGRPRDLGAWAPTVLANTRLVQPRRIAAMGRGVRVRRYIGEARAAGYTWGEHALACALALPRRTVDALDRDGALNDPKLFMRSGLGDDPVLALLVRRAGYRLAGHVDEGQTFGVAWRGLPDAPDRLAARGYSIIHSIRNDPHHSEADIRRHFRTLRQEPRFSPRAGARRPSG